jgi:hypothetical protein
MSEAESLATNLNLASLTKIMTSDPQSDSMVKSERKREVLQFLEEHPLALPLSALYRNLRLHRSITFGKETMRLYMNEFVEDRLVARLDMGALEDGKIEEAPESDRAYYIITDAGRAHLRDEK